MLSKLVKSVFFAVFLLVGTGLALAVVIIEKAPSVQGHDAPTPEDVAAAQRVVGDIKRAARPGIEPAQPLVVTEETLDSVLRLGVRLIPGFRGAVGVEPGGLEMRASVPLPLPGPQRWVNIVVSVPQFEDRIKLRRVALGPVTIPPGLALELGRIGANAVLGGGLGTTMITAASGMRVAGDSVSVDLQIDEVGKNGIMVGVFGALRGDRMPPQALVNHYHLKLREAMERGDLPERGSYLPYLVFMLETAREGARSEGRDDAFTAAIFALTRVCGARDFALVAGNLANVAADAGRDWQTRCRGLTLNGRIDSRRHFTTAAALQAASNRDVSVSVGEYKELFDTLHGGFDFTDMAANHSGIRLANLYMATPVEEWDNLIARIRTEADVIVPHDEIPQILTRAEFSERFGEIDSDRYRAMLDRIERKIDALALHAP